MPGEGGRAAFVLGMSSRLDGWTEVRYIPELHRAAQGATADRQQWSRMRAIGQAAAKWDDGEEYEGGWVRGQASGEGHATKEGWEYKGQWKGGKAHGKGAVRRLDGGEWAPGTWHAGRWENPQGLWWEGQRERQPPGMERRWECRGWGNGALEIQAVQDAGREGGAGWGWGSNERTHKREREVEAYQRLDVEETKRMETSWLAGVTEACRSEKQTELRRVLGLLEELGQAARPRGADWGHIAAALQAAGATAGVVDRANRRGQEVDGRGHGVMGGMDGRQGGCRDSTS